MKPANKDIYTFSLFSGQFWVFVSGSLYVNTDEMNMLMWFYYVSGCSTLPVPMPVLRSGQKLLHSTRERWTMQKLL